MQVLCLCSTEVVEREVPADMLDMMEKKRKELIGEQIKPSLSPLSWKT